MNVRPKFDDAGQMTIAKFLAFTRTRPDDERWELIEGVPVLSPSPVDFHQMVCANLITHLMNTKVATGAGWLAMPGIGTRVPVSERSLPQPDVFVLEGLPRGLPVTDDALVIFEVLSKSNRKADREWRQRVYTSVPNCQHYVTVSLKSAEVAAFDRATGWTERKLRGLAAALELSALEVTLPLADIYRYTPVGEA